jgi:hypothetical protein
MIKDRQRGAVGLRQATAAASLAGRQHDRADADTSSSVSFRRRKTKFSFCREAAEAL